MLFTFSWLLPGPADYNIRLLFMAPESTLFVSVNIFINKNPTGRTGPAERISDPPKKSEEIGSESVLIYCRRNRFYFLYMKSTVPTVPRYRYYLKGPVYSSTIQIRLLLFLQSIIML